MFMLTILGTCITLLCGCTQSCLDLDSDVASLLELLNSEMECPLIYADVETVSTGIATLINQLIPGKELVVGGPMQNQSIRVIQLKLINVLCNSLCEYK